jgi:hypothetical protein
MKRIVGRWCLPAARLSACPSTASMPGMRDVNVGVGPDWLRTVSCVSARVRVMVEEAERKLASGRKTEGSGAVVDKSLLTAATTLDAGGVAAAS